MKKRVFALIVLSILIVFTGCETEKNNHYRKSKISIGYQPTIFYSYLFVAKYYKMFEKANLKVDLIKFTSANKMFQAFLAGQLDVTGLTATEIMLRGYEKDSSLFLSPLYIELNKQFIADHILVRKNSSISSLLELKGKKIGSHPGTTVPNVLTKLMLENNIKPEEYSIQTLKTELQVDALLSGAVDALICLEPTGTRLMMTGECEVLYDNPFSVIAEQVPAAFNLIDNEFINMNPQQAKQLKIVIEQAVDKYYELYKTDKTKLANILLDYLNMNNSEFLQAPMVVYRKSSAWQTQAIQEVEQFYFENKVLSRMIDIEKIKYTKKP